LFKRQNVGCLNFKSIHGHEV